MTINLDKQYQLYLRNVGLVEEEMFPVQKTETRRAFIGGFGQAFLVLTEDIGSCPDEDEAAEAIEDVIKQVRDFWAKEINPKREEQS